ncbi:TIGR00266 family protein [Candidatus Woesearchaeota archaeon]|nr:TIGR00266 family protein [Candidatus Woesearchaeota archaeon]
MKHNITGTVMQTVNIELKKEESIISQRGGMTWMSDNITIDTTVRGGIIEAVKRKFTGESVFMTKFTCTEGTGVVSFGADFPGKILPLHIEKGKDFIAQKKAFLCAEPGVNLTIEFRKKFGRGFFGGEGFVLQRISGKGLAFVNIEGEILQVTLKKGQKLRIDTGYIAMYEPTIDYDIERIRGTRNIFFGGEGIFLATLTGPGKVWLQSMTSARLAGRLAGFFTQGRSSLLGSLFGGR